VDVRGPGFMNAIEFNDRKTGLPSPDLAAAVKNEAFVNGLLVLTCGGYGNVIRFLAPLTIQDGVLMEGLDLLERSIRKVIPG